MSIRTLGLSLLQMRPVERQMWVIVGGSPEVPASTPELCQLLQRTMLPALEELEMVVDAGEECLNKTESILWEAVSLGAKGGWPDPIREAFLGAGRRSDRVGYAIDRVRHYLTHGPVTVTKETHGPRRSQ